MNRRIAVAVAALLLATAAAGAGTARAGAGDAVPSDPDTAAALATAPAPVASGSSTQLVPASSIAAAGSANAAVTPIWCWATAFWQEWGTWPYQQRVTDTTYWCALLGKSITSRSTSVTGTGTLCATGWTASQLISGGIGYPWFTMRSSAGFSCPTVIPWVTLHENRWMDINRTDTGGTSEVADG